MTKAARIRALYAEGKGCSEIASLVGCRVEYVRVCARQRGSSTVSVADRRYLLKRYGAKTLIEAWRKDYRARHAYYARYARLRASAARTEARREGAAA